MKKHILFLARAFPPAPVIAAVRCWNMADQLRKHGWRLTVMTIEDEYWINAAEDERRVWRDAIESRTIECIRTGHHLRSLPGAMRRAWYEGPDWIGRGLRKAAHIAGIDSGIGWVPCLKERITSELMQSVDIILADGSPFSVFEFSRKLAMKTNRPYVLDFRDLWHCNPLRGRRSRPWEIASERRCVRDAAALITVSASTARTLKKIHNLERDVTVISNGFSPSDFQNLPSMDLGPYALVYAGSLYPPKITLDPLLKALQLLCETDPSTPVRLHLFGKMGDEVKEAADAMGIGHLVMNQGLVSRKRALAAFRAARMGVVVTSIYPEATDADQGVMTGKLFEVLGAGTPVLLIAPDRNDATHAIRDRGIGVQFDGSRYREMAEYLRRMVREPKWFNASEAAVYSWDHLGLELNGVLENVIRCASEPVEDERCVGAGGDRT